MDLALLDTTLADLGQPAFRATQVWEWTARGAGSYEEMTNLPESLRAQLAERVPLSSLTVEHEALASDGTEKVLLRTGDARPLEAVLMRFRDGRRSLCVSSQSGCPLTCTFCATGTMKFGRNLTTSEILDQALHFRRKEDVDHLVFMGMGEPLMNLDNVLGACERLPDIGIHPSSTTISTVGWIPGIERLTERDGPTIRLALSLHAPDDDLRSELMPVNDRYPLADVLAACLRWHEQRRRRVYIEYLMLDGVNDSPEQALQLARVLTPHEAFKVNLIPYNPTDSGLTGSSREAIDTFVSTLHENGVPATVRLTRGRDIDAACGQLAVKA
ncbi:MAG TPA: 23S rRNA (adenine(2503)-C(2))-methyltransferase RlmN [Thermoleophilaceae bacterium]|nr:23S rRNA (adenine(2503)-C(2))-methyltransferase RlmN [Thermoleophilaceae bacterium]